MAAVTPKAPRPRSCVFHKPARGQLAYRLPRTTLRTVTGMGTPYSAPLQQQHCPALPASSGSLSSCPLWSPTQLSMLLPLGQFSTLQGSSLGTSRFPQEETVTNGRPNNCDHQSWAPHLPEQGRGRAWPATGLKNSELLRRSLRCAVVWT